MKNTIILFFIIFSLSLAAQEQSYDSIEEGLKNPEAVTVLYLINQHLNLLPNDILLFKNVEEIILDENPNLNLDQAFSILAQLKKLKSLSLSKCNLNSIPVSIKLLSTLEELDLSHNNITYFPEPIKALSNLKILNFFDAKMSKLHFLNSDLPNLEYINLCYNNFEVFPTDLGNLQSLKTIRIWANNMLVIPSDVEKLKYVEEINLDMNNLDSLPPEFSKLKSLKILSLEGNNLNEKSIDILYTIRSIEKLDLGKNQIHSLSPTIKKLAQLKYLNISENPITAIPSEIKALKKLEQLGLGGLINMNWKNAFSTLSEVTSLKRVGMYLMKRRKMPKGFEKLQQVSTFWLTSNSFNKDERERIASLVPNAKIVFD